MNGPASCSCSASEASGARRSPRARPRPRDEHEHEQKPRSSRSREILHLNLRFPLDGLRLALAITAASLAFTTPTHASPHERFADAEIEYRGNDTLWEWTLSRQLGDFEERSIEAATIADAAHALERYYRTRGFPFARVSGSLLDRREDGKPVVRFRIEEGARPAIAAVTIAGNQRFSEDRIRSVLEATEHRWWSPSFVAIDRLDEDARRIEELYVGNGYIEARAGYAVAYRPDRAAARVLWEVREGAHYVFDRIEVRGNRAFDAATLIRATDLRAGVDFYPARANEVRDAIERHYRDRGFALARAAAEIHLDPVRCAGAVIVTVDEGGPKHFGTLVIRGNQQTAAGVIERAFRFERGAPFSALVLQDAERRLFEMGLFERVTTEAKPSATDPSAVDIIVTVEERPAGRIRLGTGYGSFDGLRGQLAGSYANLFGRGIQVDGRVIGSQRGYRAEAGLGDPFILGTPLRYDIDLYLEDRDVQVFDVERRGGTGFLSYPLPFGARVAAGVRAERSNVSELQRDVFLEDESVNLVSGILRVSRDGRDDPLYPRWGTYHEAALEEAGIFGLGTARFTKVTAAGAYFVSPLPRLTLALGARGGAIFPHGGVEVPIQERFFLGGETGPRGFDLNEVGEPAGGDLCVLTTAEARIDGFGPIGFAAFIDAGGIFARPRDFAWADVRWTPGAGLRVRTPIGPLRLDVGFNPDRREGEDPYEVHFSVGYPF